MSEKDNGSKYVEGSIQRYIEDHLHNLPYRTNPAGGEPRVSRFPHYDVFTQALAGLDEEQKSKKTDEDDDISSQSETE